MNIKLASILLTKSTKFNESLLGDELVKLRQSNDLKTVEKNDLPQILFKVSKLKLKPEKIRKESDASPTICRPDVKEEVVPRMELVLWAQGDRLLDSEWVYPSEKSRRALASMHKAPEVVIKSSTLAWGCELPMQAMPERTSSPFDTSDVREKIECACKSSNILVISKK